MGEADDGIELKSKILLNMTSKAIQVAITHTAVGIMVGAAIEAFMPRPDSGSPMPNQVFEALVQVGLNGAALSLVCPSLQCGGSDPTFGIPFGAALFAAQPDMQVRLVHLAAGVRSALVQGALQTVAPVATASGAN